MEALSAADFIALHQTVPTFVIKTQRNNLQPAALILCVDSIIILHINHFVEVPVPLPP